MKSSSARALALALALVARDLSITVCCGEYYCQVCISPFQEGSKPCPGCGQEGFSVVPHVRYRNSILALEVCCFMKEHGCEWTGELQHSYIHLKNDCTFVGSHSFPCPNGCAHSIEQSTLEAHLEECPYQEVECGVRGCGEKFKRKDKEVHMVQRTGHLPLLGATQRRSIRSQESLHQKVKQLKERLKEMTEKLSNYPMIPPVDFTLQEFDEKKANDKIWESPHFYTHLEGYKLCLKIWPNGCRGTASYTNAVTIKLYTP